MRRPCRRRSTAPGIADTKVIVAPNSPSALAKARIIPATRRCSNGGPAGCPAARGNGPRSGALLLASPWLLLLDEPLASLDEARERETLPYIERLRDELAVPIVYVSHSRPEIERLAGDIVHVEAGRARI
jgi:hypothetical protein